MPMHRLCILIIVLAAGAADAADDGALVDATSPGQPRLAYVVERDGARLRIRIDVATGAADGDAVQAMVGVAAAKHVVLAAKDAKVERAAHRASFTWLVPAPSLVQGDADWKALRLGVDVRWTGGPGGGDRRHERYLHVDHRAPSAGLSPEPKDWAPVDLEDLALRLADSRDRIVVPLRQPMDGKYSLVIEDEQGRRVRNLAGGLPAAKGDVPVEWDGCDDDGRLVDAGAYRWRSIHHPGIAPEYAMTYLNGDEPGFMPLLPNHTHFVAATANRDVAVLAAVGTEGGCAIAAFDAAGRWKHGYNNILGVGWSAVAVAMDDANLYVAQDGEGWGSQIDKGKPDWQGEVTLSLTRFTIASGDMVDYAGGHRWREIERHPWGPGAKAPALRDGMSLTGLALVGGKLYVGSRAAGALLVVDPASGDVVDRIPLADPGALAAAKGRLVAMSGAQPMLIDTTKKTATPYLSAAAAKAVALDALTVRGLALSDDGALYLADGRSSTVRVVTTSGQATTIGVPGGAYVGRWQPERMVAPTGLALVGNRLWVAEDRTSPKRAVAWDLGKRTVAREVFGDPSYGGPGGGFDPHDPTRWLGDCTWWTLDLAHATATPRAVIAADPPPLHWRFIRQENRTYLLGMGMLNALYVVGKDDAPRRVAAWASCHHFSYAHNWHPPAAFVESFNRAYPDQKFIDGTPGTPGHGPGVLWVDRNGDGEMQAGEFEFSGADRLCGGGWGHDESDLTIHLPAVAHGSPAVVALVPKGIDDHGVPRYPTLAEALAAAPALQDVPKLDYRGVTTVSSATHGGDLVVLSTPMTCWRPDGRLRWRYPNPYADVHGSQAAPLPQPGIPQGTLFVLGMAPLDGGEDVFVVNGNHGRFVVMTSDGMYLDEMFNDCRVAQTRDANLIGGECFGGVFGRSDDGTYWMQTGGDGLRVYRVRGLDHVRRADGRLDVTPKQLVAAQRRLERRVAETAQARAGALRAAATPPHLDGSGDGWPAGEPIAWNKQGHYGVAVRAAFDATNLYLRWEVAEDHSPWVNNGHDWTLLFKTGDSVDLQLGTDPAADPRRHGAVPGDLRLLIAPMGQDNVAVLYRHRVPGAKQPVAFTSPWRSETVDEVRRLTSARIAVRKRGDGYDVDAAVPLAELGLRLDEAKSVRADLGVIYGDDAGTVNLLRNYWANQATGLVNDVPGEIMLQPTLWGDLTVEKP